MSLRWKLAAAMLLVSSLATIAFGVASYRSTGDRLMAEVDRSLAALEPAVRARGPATLPADADGLAQFSVQFVGRDGTVLRTTFPEAVPALAATSVYATVTTSTGDYRVRVVPLRNGAALVGRPLDETYRVLEGVKRRTVLLLGLVAAASAALGVLIADRITAPLRRLTEAAEDVAATGRPARGMAHVADAAGGDEVGRLNAGFARMLRALARSQEEQERLVQDAGHELRTPLTSVRTNLDVLARYPDLAAAEREQVVADLQAEVSELAQLVDEIVAVAGGGLANGAGSEPAVTLDVTELARAVAERFARRSGRTIAVSGPSAPVVGERSGLQRALSCLLDNACKFDPSGAPIDVTISTTNDTAGELVDVRVRDRGPGIDDADRDRVFDRFHRSDAARTLPGSGLGLAIVRAVAERHGGTASAARHPDGGAIVGFTVRPSGPPEPT